MKISEKEYLEKKLNIAKEVLPTLLSGVDHDAFIADPRKRASLVYKSGALADALLREIGFESDQLSNQSKPADSSAQSSDTRAGQEKTGMIDISRLKELNDLKNKK